LAVIRGVRRWFARPRRYIDGLAVLRTEVVLHEAQVRNRQKLCCEKQRSERSGRTSRELAEAHGGQRITRFWYKGEAMAKKAAPTESVSALIDAHIKAIGDWRGKTLARVRRLIKDADPEVVEEWKWSIPVWSHDGLICTGEVYKAAVKLTFAKGEALKDPSKLFNSSLQGNTRRAIDIRENDEIDEGALKKLFREAVALNLEKR
jgi:hypothetical protein